MGLPITMGTAAETPTTVPILDLHAWLPHVRIAKVPAISL